MLEGKTANKTALNVARYKQSFYDLFHVTSRWVVKILHPWLVCCFCPHLLRDFYLLKAMTMPNSAELLNENVF